MHHILSFSIFDSWAFLLVIFYIIVPALIILAIRSIVLWYWKVNDILQNQEKQTMLLAEIAELLKTQNLNK